MDESRLEGLVAKTLSVDELNEGMVCAEEIKTPRGAVVLPAKTEIEHKHQRFFRAAGIEEVSVYVPAEISPGELLEIEYSMKLENAKKTRICIIDDSHLMRANLSDLVKELGARVVGQAENGREGIDVVTQRKPDIVTMDLKMPEMDGITATREIHKKFPHIKIIVVSVVGEEEKIVECMTGGAADFVMKPFDPQRVKRAILKQIPATP